MTKSYSWTHLNNTHASTDLIPAFFLVVLPSHKQTPTAACPFTSHSSKSILYLNRTKKRQWLVKRKVYGCCAKTAYCSNNWTSDESARSILHVRLVTKSLNQSPSCQVDKHTADQQVLRLGVTRRSSDDNTSSPLDRVMFRLINYVTHSYIKISLSSPCFFFMELTTISHVMCSI